ncbi:MAG TPA: hypothetical protein VJB94_01540 [Candidatus Nanoarchaeia archaeon]|nr:hypothetical protein [Candidatus Nanoarchaeia archaeon]
MLLQKNKLILAAVQDFGLSSRISETARNLGIEVFFMRNKAEAFRDFKSKPQMLLIDLNLKNFDPLAFIEQARKDSRTTDLTIVGYLSPAQTSLREKALKSGCDKVLTRLEFETRISTILSGGM